MPRKKLKAKITEADLHKFVDGLVDTLTLQEQFHNSVFYSRSMQTEREEDPDSATMTYILSASAHA